VEIGFRRDQEHGSTAIRPANSSLFSGAGWLGAPRGVRGRFSGNLPKERVEARIFADRREGFDIEAGIPFQHGRNLVGDISRDVRATREEERQDPDRTDSILGRLTGHLHQGWPGELHVGQANIVTTWVRCDIASEPLEGIAPAGITASVGEEDKA